MQRVELPVKEPRDAAHGASPDSRAEPVLQDARPAMRDEPMLYCPVCSLRLTARKCKLLCERCGYYMSCADYY
jgi:hypothetical protein